jgi:hypothetical protein
MSDLSPKDHLREAVAALREKLEEMPDQCWSAEEIDATRQALGYLQSLAKVANAITVTAKTRPGRGEWVDFEHRNCDGTVSIQRVYDETSGHRGLFIPDKGIKPNHADTIKAEGWDAMARGLLDHMAVAEWTRRNRTEVTP